MTVMVVTLVTLVSMAVVMVMADHGRLRDAEHAGAIAVGHTEHAGTVAARRDTEHARRRRAAGERTQRRREQSSQHQSEGEDALHERPPLVVT
jgi:hypothetical protein